MPKIPLKKTAFVAARHFSKPEGEDKLAAPPPSESMRLRQT
jgi:hypothetical protein